jgi:predicted transcriptional regulator
MSRKLRDRTKLPKIIKIGVHEYELIHLDPVVAEEKEVFGLCNRMTLKISVRSDLPDSAFAETLEHEINHGCWHAASLDDEETEEEVVLRLTPVMIMARRDNPEIYAWIDRAIAQKD